MTNSNRFVTGSQTLEITNYSFIKKNMTNGQYIQSDPFTVGSHQWAIDFYPNGIKVPNADSISILVRLLNPKDPVKALYTHRLKDWSSGIGGAWSTDTQNANSVANFSATGNTSYGFFDFMKHSDLEASRYLQNDTLIIKTTVWVLN